MVDKVVKSDAEWRAQLTPLQYIVTRRKGTERAFTGAYCDEDLPGIYMCVCCGSALFNSRDKFDSGTGWPSFAAPLAPEAVITEDDFGWLIRRKEVMCARCAAHLGHVLDDPNAATGLRYCINSAALRLQRDK